MQIDERRNFVRQADGTWRQMRADGTLVPIVGKTDLTALAALSEQQIEELSRSDRDHPALDDEFWSAYDAQRGPSSSGRR